MINRSLLRLRVVQTLFAYYSNGVNHPKSAERSILQSFQDTYDLYFQLLLLAVDVTRHAQAKIENGRNKLLPSYEDLHPNVRFAENTFVAQLEGNIDLAFRLKENKALSWTEYPEVIAELYRQITETDFYKEYMSAEVCGYEEDKKVWRKVYDRMIETDPLIEDVLENMSAYWVCDLGVVCSFVVKTIKRFDAEQGMNQPLLPMFTDAEDEEYALGLLRNAIEHHDEYQELVNEHAKNWDVERLAYMDGIIMLVAVAELMTVPTIPVNVTLNEYMEIAKEYSTEKSASFINGVLDDIVKRLKNEKKLMKVALI